MTFASDQRKALLDAMAKAGPLAKTSCAGWTVQDLAAHLWVRENRLSALPGIGFEKFASTTRRLQQEALHRIGFIDLLDELRIPPFPMSLIDRWVGGTEFYLHHEDVLRPSGQKVSLSSEQERKLAVPMWLLAKKAQRAAKVRLVVTPVGGHSKSFGKGERVVYVEGETKELLLHFSGRDGQVIITAADEQAYRKAIKGL